MSEPEHFAATARRIVRDLRPPGAAVPDTIGTHGATITSDRDTGTPPDHPPLDAPSETQGTAGHTASP